jgi:hypothetical protein
MYGMEAKHMVDTYYKLLERDRNFVGTDGIEFVGASAEEADDVVREAESTEADF